MRVIEEVRRLRLIELKKEFGSYSKLNELMGRASTDSTFSQIANQAPDSSTSKLRAMGSTQARALEKACGKEVGWMDTDPDLAANKNFSAAVAEIATGLEALEADDRETALQLFKNTLAAMRKPVVKPAAAPEVITLPNSRSGAL